MRRKLLFSLAVSLFFAFCFLRIVYFDFEKIRQTLILNEDGPNIEFSIPSDPRTTLLLLEIKNFSPFEIAVQAEPGSQSPIEVEANGKSLIYIEPQNSLRLFSEKGEWQLRRAELRNYYGAHKGPLNYLILSAFSSDYKSPSWLLSALLFFILFPLTFVFPQLRTFGWVVLSLVLLFLICLIILPFLLPYKVLFAAKTFCLALTLLYLPAIRPAYRFIRNKAVSVSPQYGVRYLHTTLAVLAVFLFFFFQMLHSLKEFNGNYSGFLILSKKYVLNNPLLWDRPDITQELMIAKGQGGYDGQFFYIMSFDPFLNVYAEKPRLYRRVVDNPPYRYGRIGFSFLTKMFSLNTPAFYPNAMIYLILFSHALALFYLARLAMFNELSPFWALLYALIPAFTVALRFGLPESVASAFLIAGFFYYVRRKLILAGAFFAASILIRETTILFVLIVAVRELLLHRKKEAFLFAVSVMPYILWRSYVGWKLFPTFGWKAIFYNPEGTDLPFAGIWALFRALNRGEYIPEMATAAATFAICLIFLFALSAYLFWRRKDWLTFALICYSLFAASLDYKNVLTPILNAERVTYEAFVLMLIAFLSFKYRVIERALFVLFFLLLLFYDWSILSYSSIFRAGFLLDVLAS